MGNFIFMSGVIGKSIAEVAAGLEQFITAQGGVFQKAEFQETNEMSCSIFENEVGVTVLYPMTFFAFAECSTYISNELNCPVFSFHVHDGDLWMYELFNGGQTIDKFNPIPNYWDDSIAEIDIDKQKGNPKLVAELFDGIETSSIEKYYLRWSEDSSWQKAYAEDEFGYESMQVFDFIKKTGLESPIKESDNQKKVVYDLALFNQFDF